MLDLANVLSNRNVNVFFLFPSRGGDTGKQALRLELNKKGYKFAFLPYTESVHNKNKKDYQGILFRDYQNKKALKQMEAYADKWKIDLVHTNSIVLLVGAMLAKRIHKPHIWHIREQIEEAFNLQFDHKLLYQIYFNRASKVICVSNYIKEQYQKEICKTSSCVIYNGIDMERYKISKKEKDCNRFNILMCGRIDENKGQKQAVHAVEKIIKEENYKKIHLKIVGEGNGRYFLDLKKYVKEQGLETYIDILPFQSDLKELRKESDISLVCSKSEAFGRVTVEGMLGRDIVIEARTSGTMELIQDGITGYLYEYGNIEDLKNKILQVIFTWELQGKVMDHAQKYAVQNFSNQMSAHKILRIYQQAIRNHKK